MEKESWMKEIKGLHGELIGIEATFCVTPEEAEKRWPEAYRKFRDSTAAT